MGRAPTLAVTGVLVRILDRMGEELSPDPRAKLVEMSRGRSFFALAVVAPALASFALAGCSDTDRSASRFCSELSVELPLLGGPFVDGGDVDDLVGRYEKLNGITPLAIDEEWNALTDLVRLASEVDVDDPASRQDLADTAYKTERSARDVAIWVETTCGLTMPDVVGVEGSVPVSIPTTLPPIPETPVIPSPPTVSNP